MIFCYDLARCPPTFDVVTHLALLEGKRIELGADSAEIHILPGPAGGFRRDSLWPSTVAERITLRDEVCEPLCWLLPSVKSVTVRSDRGVEGWGKNEYVISLPGIVKALKAGLRPLRAKPGRVDSRRPYVTMTLRESVHHPLRNSTTAEWAAAVLEIAVKGYDVLVFRDAARKHEPLGLRTDRVSQVQLMDVGTRALLYENAVLNVGICNGPMWMAVFMDAPLLMLRPTTNSAQGCYDDGFYRRWGLPPGSQLPTSPPHQRLVWGQDDSRGTIVREVLKMLDDLTNTEEQDAKRTTGRSCLGSNSGPHGSHDAGEGSEGPSSEGGAAGEALRIHPQA